jgi:hypothetical protein
MTEPRLSIHHPGIAHHNPGTETDAVSLPLSEILKPLADAMVNNRQWLYDFAHEPIKISKDLAEVLQSVQQIQASQAKTSQQRKAA